MTSVSDEILERRADLLVDAKDRLLEDLVSLRKEHKLSQQTVAERMGVDDCGEGVPATWQMTGAAKATVRVPATPRQAQTISITQELAHV